MGMPVIQLYDNFVDALAYVAVTLLLAIMVGISADVAARYFFGDPIGWMLEFVEHSLLCILFFGMPWLTRQGGHVSIDMLVEALPITQRRLLVTFNQLVAGTISAFVGSWSVFTAIDNFQRSVETNGIYPMPRGYLIAVVALGFALTSIEFFRRAYCIYHASDEEILSPHRGPDLEP
jgi:C4-dicarboxylate transporter, DctQ subunit